MTRAASDEWEVSMSEAAKWLAMTQQGVGQWADQAPPEYVRTRGKRRVLIWPGFMVWYRQRLQDTRQRSNELEDRRARKMATETEMLELDLAKARGEVVSMTSVREQMRHIASTIRAQLLAVPGRYSPRTVGIATLPESQRVWDSAVRDVLAELRDGDGAR